MSLFSSNLGMSVSTFQKACGNLVDAVDRSIEISIENQTRVLASHFTMIESEALSIVNMVKSIDELIAVGDRPTVESIDKLVDVAIEFTLSVKKFDKEFRNANSRVKERLIMRTPDVLVRMKNIETVLVSMKDSPAVAMVDIRAKERGLDEKEMGLTETLM